MSRAKGPSRTRGLVCELFPELLSDTPGTWSRAVELPGGLVAEVVVTVRRDLAVDAERALRDAAHAELRAEPWRAIHCSEHNAKPRRGSFSRTPPACERPPAVVVLQKGWSGEPLRRYVCTQHAVPMRSEAGTLGTADLDRGTVKAIAAAHKQAREAEYQREKREERAREEREERERLARLGLVVRGIPRALAPTVTDPWPAPGAARSRWPRVSR